MPTQDRTFRWSVYVFACECSAGPDDLPGVFLFTISFSLLLSSESTSLPMLAIPDVQRVHLSATSPPSGRNRVKLPCPSHCSFFLPYFCSKGRPFKYWQENQTNVRIHEKTEISPLCLPFRYHFYSWLFLQYPFFACNLNM